MDSLPIIPDYPDWAAPAMAMRKVVHPMFQALSSGISEFTFASIYLFQTAHKYRFSKMRDNTPVILGEDGGQRFFMCPFGLPERSLLEALFDDYLTLKCATEEQADRLSQQGYAVVEDRNNFDYLYTREGLAELPGSKYHKKRNLIRAFVNNHAYEGRPLLDEYLPHALEVLEQWQKNRDSEGDYYPAREALLNCHALQLCGGIYYVDDSPVAYTLGEELARGTSFVIHFEKALDGYKGIYQFVNQAFAAIITDHYQTVNREQDLGNPGLRQAKMSYRPVDFVKKFLVSLP